MSLRMLNEEVGYKRGRNRPTFFAIFACLAMAITHGLWLSCSGLPVPFCIDLAVSKCLEQKNLPFYPKIKRAVRKKKNQLFYASNGGTLFYGF